MLITSSSKVIYMKAPNEYFLWLITVDLHILITSSSKFIYMKAPKEYHQDRDLR